MFNQVKSKLQIQTQLKSKLQIQTSGKVILFGEHSVVYGHPAIACAIENALNTYVEISEINESRDETNEITSSNQGEIIFDFQILAQSLRIGQQDLDSARFKEDFLNQATDQRLLKAILLLLSIFEIKSIHQLIRIQVTGDLPIGVGLGSSASLSIALVKSFAFIKELALTKEQINQYTLALEGCFHDKPSGLDQHVILNQGAWRFQKLFNEGVHIGYDLKKLTILKPLYFVIAWVPRNGDTLKAVQMVREKRTLATDLMDGLFEQMGKIAQQAELDLAEARTDRLALLFELNHGYLNACGLSTVQIESIIAIAKQNGAIGAKLTGAGLGGSVLILCDQSKQSQIVEALKANAYPAMPTKIDLS